MEYPLIRFDDREWLEKLQNGEFFMRTSFYYQRVEADDLARSDPYDGCLPFPDVNGVMKSITGQDIKNGRLMMIDRFVKCFFHCSRNDMILTPIYSPNRFLEQVIAFEYLFDKLDHKKAQDSNYPLKAELKQMLDEFPQMLSGTSLSSDDMSEMIKEVRRKVTHGYTYYYDFKSDINKRYMMNVLDRLLKSMSLLYIGFGKEEIADYLRRL